ncbi:MAG: HEAT repeat domain-containing protein [Planctomycetota bacterium]|nr:HEAT repeat domain-containing protein [Planctomycetota bacterium]
MNVSFPARLLSALCALLLAPAPPLAQGKGPDPRLAQAKRLLAHSREGQVTQGKNICVRANSVQSVELLLHVLQQTSPRGLAAAHYRDIVWDGLVQITDLYARRRVERELKKGRSAWVRQWCAELLGIYGDAEFGPSLTRALSDQDAVKRAAARSLGIVRFEPAAPALIKLIHKKNIFIRANAVEALALIDSKKYEETFLKALQDTDGGVRCALLGAAAGIYPDKIEQLSAATLQDPDWRPRLQAVDNLTQIRTKTSVDALIEAVRDARPAVTVRAVKALQSMTGKEIHLYDVWKKWWQANRADFEFPDGAGGAAAPADDRTVVYNDIPVVSDHVAFLIDKSRRMIDRLQSKQGSKEMEAQRELNRVLSKLRGRLVFNVFVYREDARAFSKKAVKLDARNQKAATSFVRRAKSRGAKDIWNVLEKVVSDPDLDTAYLLSSGEPDVGLYVHWNRVTAHLRDLNRFHKVVVHTVVYSERKWFRDQLEKIAQVTGGEFKWFK